MYSMHTKWCLLACPKDGRTTTDGDPAARDMGTTKGSRTRASEHTVCRVGVTSHFGRVGRVGWLKGPGGRGPWVAGARRVVFFVSSQGTRGGGAAGRGPRAGGYISRDPVPARVW